VPNDSQAELLRHVLKFGLVYGGTEKLIRELTSQKSDVLCELTSLPSGSNTDEDGHNGGLDGDMSGLYEELPKLSCPRIDPWVDILHLKDKGYFGANFGES
jgi:hypothetical protein